MKKILSVLIVSLMVLVVLASCNSNNSSGSDINDYIQPISTQKGEYGTFSFKEMYGDTAAITDYVVTKYTSHEIVIPSTIISGNKKLTVTTISENAFYSCTLATSVKIPDTIEEIGKFAFANCSDLREIVLPASLKTLGDGAFNGCEVLSKVTFNTKIDVLTDANGSEYEKTVGAESIGKYAFMNCEKITSLTLPESLISIGEGAFKGCTGLTEIVIPSSVTTIDSMAFYHCTNVKSLVLTENIQEIGDYAFSGIEKEYVTVPEGCYAAEYVEKNLSSAAEEDTTAEEATSEGQPEETSAEETTAEETTSEETTVEETTTEEPETQAAYTKDVGLVGPGNGLAMSWDSIYKNEVNNLYVPDGGAADKLPGAPIVATDGTWTRVFVRGWAGSKNADNKIVSYGYKLNKGDTVRDDSAVIEAEGPVISAGGDTRFCLGIPLTGITQDTYISVYAILADNTEVEMLNFWVKGYSKSEDVYHSSVSLINGNGGVDENGNQLPVYINVGGNSYDGATVLDTITAVNRKITLNGWFLTESGIDRIIFSVDGGKSWSEASVTLSAGDADFASHAEKLGYGSAAVASCCFDAVIDLSKIDCYMDADVIVAGTSKASPGEYMPIVEFKGACHKTPDLVIDFNAIADKNPGVYNESWAAAGYSIPVMKLGYGSKIDLGEVDLSQYKYCYISYGADGGADLGGSGVKANIPCLIGLSTDGHWYGAINTEATEINVGETTLAYGACVDGQNGWASGIRTMCIDIFDVTYFGQLYTSHAQTVGNEIAISAIVFSNDIK